MMLVEVACWTLELLCVIIHQRRGYLGEWANADKIDLLVLLHEF
jgi:hypothetical protein